MIDWKSLPNVGEPIPMKPSHVERISKKENDQRPEAFKADFRWRCPSPGCRTTVMAFKEEGATLQEICTDGRCCYCRKGKKVGIAHGVQL